MPLGAKLRVPLPRRALLHRGRLANPFLAAHLPRLVLISAPPGFGKTTLLAQWLAEVSARGELGGAHVCWVSLDAGDADAGQFVASLVESLAGASDLAGDARALLATGRPVPVDQVLATVLNELDVAVGRTIIALDDLHRAASPAVHDALAYLLENLPPQVVVAVTTRADPPLPLARLRTTGELVEVRAADLRFTSDESDGFLRSVMNLELQPSQVGALEARTEGWAAGLQLAALSVRSHASSEVDSFLRDFGGSHRFIVDYLVEEVLDAQPAEVRQFLLLTSVLERLSGPLCEALTGASGGQQQLERLESANVFLTAFDEERQWFRYHQLFAEALQARLQAEHPGRVPGLHRAASQAYAAAGLLEDALTHALRSGDTAWAGDLVESALPGIRQRRGDRTLRAWIDQLPDDVVRRRPVLATTRAWSRLVGGDLAATRQWLDVAEAALSAAGEPPDPPDSGPVLPAALLAARDSERRTAPANIAVYRAAVAQAEGDVPETVRQAELARTSAPEDQFVQGAAAGFLGLAAWAAGDVARAIDVFGGAVAHMTAAGDLTDQLGATVVLADMAVADGRIDDALRLYERALGTASGHPLAATAVAADLHVGLAGVLIELDDLDVAAEHLEEARALGEPASLQENRFRAHVAAAALLRAGGDLDGALEQLDEAERRYLPGFFPDLRPIAAQRARVLIAAGRLADARRWASNPDVTEADPDRYLSEYTLLTAARVRIAEHRAASDPAASNLGPVLDVLAHIATNAEAAQRRGSLVEARLVRALALLAAGDAPAADESLAIALADALRSGHVRLFLDEGPAMQALLQRQVDRADPDIAALAGRLLDRTPDAVGVRPAAGVDALSERELDVLRLLATDLTGPEIAAHLFVSINTLRTHTKHIFGKLQATTRRAAVSRAQERHLL